MEDFSLILDADEMIIKTYKPNKKRYTLISLFALSPFIIVPTMFVVLSILMLTNVINVVNEDGSHDYSGAIIMMIFSLIFILFIISTPFIKLFSYKKAMYCITNKRVIIRHGLIGVDFKSLSISSIVAINVEVNALDKMIKPVTGTITFASAATPITTGKEKNNVPFAFSCIENPYDVYREIKTIVDANTK